MNTDTKYYSVKYAHFERLVHCFPPFPYKFCTYVNVAYVCKRNSPRISIKVLEKINEILKQTSFFFSKSHNLLYTV